MFVHEFEQKRYKLQGFYLGSPKLGYTGVNFFFLKCFSFMSVGVLLCTIHMWYSWDPDPLDMELYLRVPCDCGS